MKNYISPEVRFVEIIAKEDILNASNELLIRNGPLSEGNGSTIAYDPWN